MRPIPFPMPPVKDGKHNRSFTSFYQYLMWRLHACNNKKGAKQTLRPLDGIAVLRN